MQQLWKEVESTSQQHIQRKDLSLDLKPIMTSPVRDGAFKSLHKPSASLPLPIVTTTAAMATHSNGLAEAGAAMPGSCCCVSPLRSAPDFKLRLIHVGCCLSTEFGSELLNFTCLQGAG